MKTNTVILGPIGTGKSFAKRTLLAEYPDVNGKIQKGAGLRVMDLACEPGWKATSGDLTCEMGYHVCEVLPANPSWQVNLAWLDKISNMSADSIKKMDIPSSIRSGYRQFMDLYKACINFICINCNENFGCVDDWGEDTALCSDGLTGISKMAVQFTVGPKPTLSWPEIDAAQHHAEGFINKCVSLRCSYVLIAHWAREPGQVEGGTNITVHTIGQKLASRLLLDTFDEVILAERNSANMYTWNLADERVDQKARRLPYKAGLRPDFTQIFSS
jgi:hypothetical protein